jgi:hypothetical protein
MSTGRSYRRPEAVRTTRESVPAGRDLSLALRAEADSFATIQTIDQ